MNEYLYCTQDVFSFYCIFYLYLLYCVCTADGRMLVAKSVAKHLLFFLHVINRFCTINVIKLKPKHLLISCTFLVCLRLKLVVFGQRKFRSNPN